MKLFLIRHGETDWNKQGRFQGREDIPLNETGIKQALNCGQALKGEHYAAVITSPLMRAKKTAEVIAEVVGTEKVIVEEDLIERDFNKISGMTPQERKAFLASGQVDNKEPYEVICKRMQRGIMKYARMFYDENIILVSHGASIRAILDQYTGGKITSKRIILKNTCISILKYNNGVMKLGAYNLTPEEYGKRKNKGKLLE
ncbi:MAG: histidine phosphatase family protein [Lachnospiraceae bacterium]|jgi:broad specificity phosphatase PhoE|nr:histidine phosphatase family protein [Lachnospiraceae bacterium]